jgi:hypothetical protein
MRLLVSIFVLLLAGSARTGPVTISTDPQATPRELYGASRLQEALDRAAPGTKSAGTVLVGVRSSGLFTGIPGLPAFGARTESFHLGRAGNRWVVIGSDASGASK